MKIAIFTLNGYENHGNRLQNLAIETVLSRYGEVSTIFQHSRNYELNKRNFLSIYNEYNSRPLSEIRHKIKEQINIIECADAKINRFLNFKKFSENNLNEIHSLINNDQALRNLSNEYDIFVVGSDQVWNPIWQEGNKYCLLPFETKAKKISIAASFGINDLDTQKEWYKNYLKDFDYITVREYQGIRILDELFIKSEICLDPTLLLPREIWETKIVEIDESSEYILLYFLGETPDDLDDFINKRITTAYKVINFNDIYEGHYYSMDPFQFISYIHNASLVLTDSFHGIVFSNIFNVPYIIFERNSNILSMNSRIETLNSLFNVNERKYEVIKNNSEIIFLRNFETFNNNINEYVADSVKRLEKMIGIEHNEI